MPRSAALLISTDASLVEACRKIVADIGALDLTVRPRFQEAEPVLRDDEVVLLLVHLVETSDAEAVAELLRQIAAARRPVACVVIGEKDHSEQALTLLRLGAVDYLTRPLDLSRLAFLVDTLTVRARYRPIMVGEEELERLGGCEPFFFMPSGQMGRLMEQVRRVAPQNTTLLLGGETGTGKTRLARLIHELSPRADEPFLVVHCGALAPSLIESEMFGHLKGAFTGADRDRFGKFADVGQGTLLLDEIDSLPPALQCKLLRAVEERVFEPVGGNRSQPVRARLLAASNRDLAGLVEAGHFRSDLYYRLNVVSFYLPPLRERPGLVRPLVARLISEFANRNHCTVRGISPEALGALESYPWPGNLRELRNTIERAVALCTGPLIQPVDLPEAIAAHAATLPRAEAAPLQPNPAITLDEVRGQAESARIEEALRRNNNNRLRAAAELGISRMTLYKKLQKYGLMTVMRTANC